jgi:alpha-beta hydrolase superfamily lysophospholipase
MTFINAVNVKNVTTPLLVLGADQDRAYPYADVRTRARAYHTDVEFHPDMGHNMMLEPGWSAVAERIDIWLSTRGL